MPNDMEAPSDRLAKTRRIKFVTLLAMVLRTGLRRRGQHPKQHGLVRAKFQVLDDIPAEYKVGLFARPNTYDALIRFSNGPQGEDREPGPQGMAIKLIDVPGRKILPKQADAGTHDFIMIDGPVFFVRETDSYFRLVNELARLPPGEHPKKWLARLEAEHPQDIAVVENYSNRIVDSPLVRQFWSQVPYAFGSGDETIARFTAIPHPGNMIAPIPPEARDRDYLRRAMVDHLTKAGQSATFDFCLQLRHDATPEIIDNPTEEWDTPEQRVAVVTILGQEFDRPEQARFGQSLSYTPWHALPEHRPVGQINEIRRTVYDAGSLARHLFTLTPRREPTSPYPPKAAAGSCLMRVVKTAAASVVAIGVIAAAILWPKLHIALPDYPAVENQVWLEQGWSPGKREWYHHANQGGQFPPLINVPYEWFIALEQPTLSLTAAGLLSDQTYLDRFGFIPSTTESGAYDWRRCREPEGGYDSDTTSPTWRHRLPVGLACSDRQAHPMLTPDAKPWRNPGTGRTMSALGLTCAACHTGRLTYGKTEMLIDGGSAMVDMVKMNMAIALSLVFTKHVPYRFDRFALRLLGPDLNDTSREALRAQLDDVLKRVAQLNELNQKVADQGVMEGYGRLDALNRIGNQVFSLDLGLSQNYAGTSAPVHYPRIWGVHWFEWAQYNGSIGQPMVRNAGEALGTGASIIMAGAPSSTTSLTAPLFTSSVQFRTLFEMEKMLAGDQQPTGDNPGFKGLVAPKWPAKILGAVDPKLVEAGAKLYDAHCAGCHLPPVASAAFWSSSRWQAPNEFGQRYLRVKQIPISEIGTDAAQAQGMASRKVKVPEELELTSDSFADALGQVVEKAANHWYDSQKPPIPKEMRQEMNGYRDNGLQAVLSYKARPLDGVWAAPPYLHNGSVPDIEALLSPLADRPKTFWLGHREYDPRRLGYRWDALSGGFEFDTSLPGNRNTGHEFDDGPARPGKIGPKLKPDERRALIEFLKSM